MRTPPNERLTTDIADASRPRPPEPEKTRPDKSGPERRCILTGDNGARDMLVRLAISPDGLVLPDPHAKAPGRGAWIGVSKPQLEQAMSGNKGAGRLKGALARAFKGAVLTVPEDLPERIEDGLRRALLDRLGLEMRAGLLILGTDRIAEHARGGGVELLMHAADAGEDGNSKLDQAWRVGRGAEGTGERGILLPLDRAALSVALGRDNVVHLAVADRRAAERVGSALHRLLHFLGPRNPGSGSPTDDRGEAQIADRPDDKLNA